jgi:hypothetical protein
LEFESDNRAASVPYSIGVRNCIGMRYVKVLKKADSNLQHSHANSQIRLVLAHLLWNFDFENLPGNIDPNNFLEYGTWQVEPLMLRVSSVETT